MDAITDAGDAALNAPTERPRPSSGVAESGKMFAVVYDAELHERSKDSAIQHPWPRRNSFQTHSKGAVIGPVFRARHHSRGRSPG